MTHQTTDTIHTEPAINRDGSVSWIASGTSRGIPFVAEAATQHDAMMEAVIVATDMQAVRAMRVLWEQRAYQTFKDVWA